MPNFAVVVLGGGPAGAVCALRLADRGVPTLLVDKATFPRDKVCGCCLNLSAVQSLHQIGLGQLPSELGGVELHDWHVRCEKLEVRCPLPGGFALSRYRLDEALIQHAAAAGAMIRTGTLGTIQAMTDEIVSIRLQTISPGNEPSRSNKTPATETITASTAIIATGLAGGGVERWLPYQQMPSGPFGVAMNVNCEMDEYAAGTISMACASDGYVGAVRIEDGTLDVAAALMPSSRQSLAQRMMQIVEHAGFPTMTRREQALGRVRTTPCLRRSRRVGCGRLIAIGDAAEYVEPFTGEGMAWAMNSGLLAADTVAERIQNRPELLGDQWRQTCQILLRRRQWPCRLITAALRSDLGRRSLFGSLNRMPWLAKPVIRYMNRAHVG